MRAHSRGCAPGIRLVLIVTGLLSVFVSGGEAFACTCRSFPPCEGYSIASAVFVGTVEGTREDEEETAYGDRYPYNVARIVVEEVFRGGVAGEVEVWSSLSGGSCGYRFTEGERYLVYAQQHSAGSGNLHTTSCSRTNPVARAGEDLAFLRGLKDAAPGATISGKVERRADHEPLAGVRVRLEGEGAERELSTAADGAYRASGLPPGEYRVRAFAPPGLRGGGLMQEQGFAEQPLRVADRGCGVANFGFDSGGRIAGRVSMEDGTPPKEVLVFVMAADQPLEQRRSVGDANVSEDGSWEVRDLPPGRYVVAMALYHGGRSPLVFYPGVFYKPDAKVFDLREGEHLQGGDLRMPDTPEIIDVTIEVRYPDGTPAGNVAVEYELYGGGDKLGHVVDPSGAMTAHAYRGLRYEATVIAGRRSGEGYPVASLEFVAGEDEEPLVMTLPPDAPVTP